MTEVATQTTAAATSRPTTWRLLVGQFRYANTSFWRTPVAAFFTLLFPVSFVIVVGAIAGDATIDSRSGIQFTQFLVPTFAVFGACMAAFVSLALSVAYAREGGVLKRLRSTPLPPWIHLAGRVAAAIWVSVIAFVIVTVVGMLFYGVQVVWNLLPAALLTFVVGVACFAALGLAVVSLAPTPGATQALANGGLILLAFVSDVFVVALPEWLDRVGWVFPLKHFVNAMADAFNPYTTGSGIDVGHLAVMLAWGALGTLIALRFFRWEPRPARAAGRRTAKPGEDTPAPSLSAAALGAPVASGEPSWIGMAMRQVRFTTLKLLRDPLSVFFAVVFPVILLIFFSSVYGSEARWGGLPLPQYLAAAFSVYGVAVMSYVNLSSTVAEDRSTLVLKRLRGTPLPPGAYLLGRIGAAVVLGAMTVAVVFGLGALLFDVRMTMVDLLFTTLAFAAIIACATALGLLLASLLESPQSVTAAALATLLPLSMVSDIFINTTGLPDTLSAIGWAFPLRHMSFIAVAASSGQAMETAYWQHLAVVVVWALLASLVAWRLFRWEPRAARGGRRHRRQHRAPAPA